MRHDYPRRDAAKNPSSMSRSLILIRHGQSVWNAQNRFTGQRDPRLTAHGKAQARALGQAFLVAGVVPDAVFTSALRRTRNTARHILAQFKSPTPKPIANAALNERDYGALTGLNKDEARARFGEEQVHLWRRSLNIAPPDGESLADTAARAVPYLRNHILPAVPRDGVCLVVAHGNSLRSLVMHLEAVSAHEIEDINLEVAEARVYSLDAQDRVVAVSGMVAKSRVYSLNTRDRVVTASSIAAATLAYSLDTQDPGDALNMVKAYFESTVLEISDFDTTSTVVEAYVDPANPVFIPYRIVPRPSATSKTARMT